MTGPNPKIFTGVYDLKTSPFAFDFITFLTISQALALDKGCAGLHVVIVPGTGTGFECLDFPKYHAHQFPIEHAQWRLMNVFMPALGLVPNLHGLTVCVSRDHGRAILAELDKDLVFPRDYDMENPPEVYWTDREASTLANLGLEFPGFRAPSDALGFIDRWIEQHAGGRKVVSMTLREGLHGSVKNSDTEAWVAFARSLDPEVYYPVFVPDLVRAFDGPRSDLGGFPVFTDPTSNLMIRTALYERSYIAMFTGCGPCSICFYDGAIRYLIFKTHPPYHKANLPWAVLMGLDPANNDMRIATPYQKRFAEGETFELLRREFDAMAARIEADPDDAFRRHTLKRTDVGPTLLSDVAEYMAIDQMAYYAVEFCQRYLERYPEQIDQVIEIMARTDILTAHGEVPVQKRSQQIYESWLKGKNTEDHVMVVCAQIKVNLALGDMNELEKLIEAIPTMNDRFKRSAIVKAGLAQIAVFYFRKGRADDALRIADATCDLYPGFDTVNLKAMILEGAGRFEEARAILLGLIARGVESPRIYESLSRIARASGDIRQSIEYMHRSMAARPADAG